LHGLREALEWMPFADEALGLLEECYREGASFGQAFRELMTRLLGPYGVLLLDPLEPAMREVAAPLLREAWERDGELLDAVMERNAELEAAGYHAQVHAEKGSTLLFVLRNGRRTAWNKVGKNVLEEVTGAVRENAAMLSPNALLRPVVQDYMLPTVAYLGGPAELAYFAQSEPVYRRLLGRMPVMMHRASFTLVDTRAGKVLDHYGLGLRDVLTPAVTLREKMAGRLVPAGLVDHFGAARERVEVEIARLGHEVLAFDPGLAKAVAKAKAKIGYQMGKLERKAAREAMRRDERAGADADYLYNALYPKRHMQERLYGLAPFLAQHGPGLVERVYAHVRPECPDHQLLRID
jgi:bacillithiol synthase